MDNVFYGNLLIDLINYFIFDEEIKDIPINLDYEEFFKFCSFHKMENIAYRAFLKLGSKDEKISLFVQRYMFNIFSISKQRTYLSMITSEFEKNDVDYLVLKGPELSKLYPSDDLRTSSDIDIYVGKNFVKCKDIMTSLGFSVNAFNAESDDHDQYSQNGVICEIHPVLIQNNYPWQSECNSITDRLVGEGINKKQMTLEDFYLYNLSHTAKHMKFSGIGIKVYLDLELIINKYEDKIDWDIVNEKLERANLTEFNKVSKMLCNAWFGNGDTDSRIEAMKEYVYNSGFCGTRTQRLASQYSNLAKNSGNIYLVKIKKCFEIFSAPYKDYAIKYPILKKHKWLTPFYRVGRMVSAVLFKQKTIEKVLGEFDEVDTDYSKDVARFKQAIGL